MSVITIPSTTGVPPSTEECPICMQSIERIYAMIENKGENGKYHTECMDSWLKKSKNGILVQENIKSITIYDHQEKLCHLNIQFKEPSPFENIFDDDITEMTDMMDAHEDLCQHICIIF